MVSFLPPADYLFGLPQETQQLGSEQGGIYYRGFISLRLEGVPNDQVEKIDKFYADLRARSAGECTIPQNLRSDEHTSELQSLMRNSYAVFCLKKQKHTTLHTNTKMI